ncbi:MAG TPA: NAD(P)-binding protein [Gemmatimonadaceae bacterium]|nr:NAD(P)-binding protein [Gemmatimonadaceae bacterium]
MTAATAKKRVVIVGGGPSGMTAAYWLSSTPELRERYDVTVYQMGWRLGGKGASGRNRGVADRIEEHGLHIIFGFYQNVFAMMRDVYGAIGRKPGAPLATWREAFHPLSAGVMEDDFRGKWQPWIEPFPRNGEVPGVGPAMNGPFDYLVMLLQVLFGALFGWRTQLRMEDSIFPSGTRWEESDDPGKPEETWITSLFLDGINAFFKLAWWLDVHVHWLTALVGFVRRLIWNAVRVAVSRFSGPHRFWTGIDLLWAVFVGIVRDRLFAPGGFAAVDEYDFRDWLGKHGAHEVTMWSPYTRAIYDAAFSYDDGRAAKEEISASVGLRTLVRIMFTYKGAMYYKMQAGMGDTIFGPMHEALRQRGVQFRFFHKASAVRLSDDGARVASIDFEQQVDLLSGDAASYAPLYDVLGLPCWPSEPLWEQVKDASRYAEIDLESYYSGWKGVRTVTLSAGVEFDEVILATPVQTLPFLCVDLARWHDRWQRMIREVKAVQTLSFQVWLTDDLARLGWTGPDLPLLSLYVQPYNTWSDMSQVLPRETWPSGLVPRNVSYFTGAQPGPDEPPPASDADFPVRMTADARRLALVYLEKHLTTLLPGAMDADAPPSVDWTLLVDLDQSREGPARFESQYWRSNCDPHERCTLALPGTGKFRIRAGDTRYANLTIAGDWIDNGIHVACLEGAVMGGIYAARAVAGIQFPIIGEMLSETVLGRV